MEDLSKGASAGKDTAVKSLLRWGQQARIDADRLRRDSPKFGFDASKMVLGHVVATILGDDRQLFFYLHEGIDDEALIRASQQNSLERIAFEIETPETPEDLREKLKAVKAALSASDWVNKDSFFASKKIWDKMRDDLEASLEVDANLKDACSYYVANHSSIPSADK